MRQRQGKDWTVATVGRFAVYLVIALFVLVVAFQLIISAPADKGMVLAAWVQAIGSILAIVAAIWIGVLQHRQNIELVEDERIRARDERGAEAADRRRALHDTAAIPIRNLIAFGQSRLQLLAGYSGSKDPVPDLIERMLALKEDCTTARNSVWALRDVFTHDPRDLLAHVHLLTAIDSVVGHTDVEIDREQQRSSIHFNRRVAALKNLPDPGNEDAIAFNVHFFVASLNHVDFVLSQVDPTTRDQARFLARLTD